MIHNPVIDAMMNRKSIRVYTEETPSEEVIETIVRAGQQAPFAYQLGSMILDRDRERHPFKAPLLFMICYDIHRMELILKKRGWESGVDDLQYLVFGMQDAAYMAQNMVIAAESLGLGSCYLGVYPFIAGHVQKKYKLPDRVYPVVGLAMGYPDREAEPEPVRPRYPMSFTMGDGQYPQMTDEAVEEAMRVMDEGYLAQDYYRKANVMIPLKGTKEESYDFDTYSWTEHISRKCALYTDMQMRKSFEKVGFVIPGDTPEASIEDEEDVEL
ncbi:MAG: nitroreductase family protein [Anaerolineaceae bacterium]|nr:nitroreductase family protein [Anaerolineaceae bacterium]